jgi:hypothetical protein
MQLRGSRTVRNMLSRFVLALVIAIPAFGQATTQFEYVYGGDCHEVGRDVKPVRYCDGDGGYVAVGTTNSYTNYDGSSCLSTTDIYVVRTTESGARIWEYRYDITVGSASGDDEGNAIIECADGSGFVIAGMRATSSTASDAILLKIDCDGGIVWAYSYNPGGLDTALDLVEADTGNGGSALVGDLLVCGTTQTPGTPAQLDGLMFRTRSTGALVWSTTMKITGSDESLFSIAEAPVQNGNPDVVAVGRKRVFNATSDGYAVRLKAYSGNITGAPQGAASYDAGTGNDDSFHSVKVLTQGSEQYNMVFVGKTNSPTLGGATDIYLVKTAAWPCSLLASNAIDNSNGSGQLNEEGMDVVEVTSANLYPNIGGISVGDLVLTGMAEVVYNSQPNPEMFLLPVQVSNLTTFAGGAGGTTFGDMSPGGNAIEGGFALEQIADTLIVCGVSQGNLENDTKVADPEDLYLVKADVDGHTRCDQPWYVVDINRNSTTNCLTPTLGNDNTASERSAYRNSIETPNSVCIEGERPDECEYCKPAIQPTPPPSGSVKHGFTMQVLPNPLPNGSALRLDVSEIDDSGLDIVVTDLSGREVFRQASSTPWSSGTLIIPTDGWAKGTYQITVRNGSVRSRSARIVIP